MLYLYCIHIAYILFFAYVLVYIVWEQITYFLATSKEKNSNILTSFNE